MARRIEIIGGHVGDNTNLVPTHGTGLGVNTSPSSFAYTLDNDVLSHEQRQFYEDNGFIVIRNLVPLEKLQVYKDYFRALCEKKVKSGMTMMRDVAIAKTEFSATEKAITKIQDFVYDDVLFEYCCLPEVLRYVKCFTGPNVRAIHTMLINKPPDPGTMTSRHPMHQDLQYFPIRPANRIVCAWTAMERVNRANGCLVAVPGTHKGELLEHDYPEWEGGVNMLYHGIKDYKPSDSDRVWLEMEAGDTVFFHPILHHGSGANRTEGFRKAISCHYAACECHYIDVKGTVQEHLAKEITEVAKKMALKKYGVEGAEFTIQDIWRGKSRLACGHEVNL